MQITKEAILAQRISNSGSLSFVEARVLCNRTAPIEPSIVGSIPHDFFPLSYEAAYTHSFMCVSLHPSPETGASFLGALVYYFTLK